MIKINNKKPLLSFVIPAYNEETTIKKCLASILKQSKKISKNIEIIVINNASTDKTKEIAEYFSRVKVIYEPKKGLVNARRAGYLASKGDLIANIDADNILTPKWINKVLTKFSKDKDLVAISGPLIYYDLSKQIQFGVKIFYYFGYLFYKVSKFIFGFGSILQGGNFIFKRNVIKKIGGYNLNSDFYGEDTELGRRLSSVGKVKFDFDLPIYSSGRRLINEGIFTMAFKYVINYFYASFFKKPFTKEYTDIRISKNNKR